MSDLKLKNKIQPEGKKHLHFATNRNGFIVGFWVCDCMYGEDLKTPEYLKKWNTEEKWRCPFYRVKKEIKGKRFPDFEWAFEQIVEVLNGPVILKKPTNKEEFQ